MAWNYRGYGLSTGTPTPYNIKRDVEYLLKYMKDTLKLRGKFGVYGRSLGGVVTTHLADKVEMIIADRTLYNFEVLANRKFFSRIS